MARVAVVAQNLRESRARKNLSQREVLDLFKPVTANPDARFRAGYAMGEPADCTEPMPTRLPPLSGGNCKRNR